MSGSKYYAVRKGLVPGIYNSWEECKNNVHGFPGAEYKSFKTLEEAKAYLGDISSDTEKASQDLVEYLSSKMTSSAIAYVDGSYNVATGEYAYGMLIFHAGKLYEECKSFDDPEMSSMRNVAGEIQGAARAMAYSVENGIDSLDIYYDYAGIEKWALGEWKTNKEGTRAYKEYYVSISDKLKVYFHKVKGHSGDMGNDRADELAKSALGIE
ncbi:MAG: ribonuclease H family protein [Eubacterium sp.]|nr:ribonuclease H family protein [Eubacterium sp.]